MEGMVLGTDGKQVIPRRSTCLNPSLATSVSHSHDVNVKVIEPSVVVNFRTLEFDIPIEVDFDVRILIASVEEYGIQKVTMNANGFSFFKFSIAQVVEDAL
ncbi:hypothetical protein Tco_0278699 [Tanacetum coccineum]